MLSIYKQYTSIYWNNANVRNFETILQEFLCKLRYHYLCLFGYKYGWATWQSSNLVHCFSGYFVSSYVVRFRRSVDFVNKLWYELTYLNISLDSRQKRIDELISINSLFYTIHTIYTWHTLKLIRFLMLFLVPH